MITATYLRKGMKLFILCGILSIVEIACTNLSVTTIDRKPNVVLIVVDDLGWKDLGIMGSKYYETPNIDRLAKEGMTFTKAYASASNCAPSRASMLSGKYTPRHGVYTVSPSDRGHPKTRRLVPIVNTKHLHEDAYTMPDMFKENGYVTGSFGKWHIGVNPSNQGIDKNVGGSGRGNPGRDGYFSPYNIDFISNGKDGEYLTDRLTDEAIQFVEENKESPFFLYFPLYTVHAPIMGKPDLIQKFQRKEGSDGQDDPEYAAMVYSMDQNIGRVLARIEELQLESNTLVVFTSDNGGIRDISNQHPLRAGKGSYYEGGIRVPLIIKYPGQIMTGTKNDTPVTNLDFFPTFEKIINSNTETNELDGVDLTPLFSNEKIERRDLFWHFPIYLQAYNPKTDDGRDPLFRTRPGSVVISGDWKLHQYFEDGSLELYDLSKDVGERNNLIDSEPEKAQELLHKLENWRIEMLAPVPVEKNPFFDAEYEEEQVLKMATESR